MKVDAKIAGDKVDEVHELSEKLTGNEAGAAAATDKEGAAVETQYSSSSGTLAERAVATVEAKSTIADAVPGPDDEIVPASEAEGTATGAASEAAHMEL